MKKKEKEKKRKEKKRKEKKRKEKPFIVEFSFHLIIKLTASGTKYEVPINIQINNQDRILMCTRLYACTY